MPTLMSKSHFTAGVKGGKLNEIVRPRYIGEASVPATSQAGNFIYSR
jgi:hypothetical protein